MCHIFLFNLHCQEFGSPLRWCFRFSSTLTQILEVWNEELLLLEHWVLDKKRTEQWCKWNFLDDISITALPSFNIEIGTPSYGLINYCKMFNHGRAICFWSSISFTDTDMEWLVPSFCWDCSFQKTSYLVTMQGSLTVSPSLTTRSSWEETNLGASSRALPSAPDTSLCWS